MFAIAEDLLRKSQERQMQQLKKLMEKETGEVMRQLQHSRKSEVKQLALVHKDKDELERMKREVDSTLVEKGVAERVRLTASYERRGIELQKQHDTVRTTLNDQKEKVSFRSIFLAQSNTNIFHRSKRCSKRMSAVRRVSRLSRAWTSSTFSFLPLPSAASAYRQTHQPVTTFKRVQIATKLNFRTKSFQSRSSPLRKWNVVCLIFLFVEIFVRKPFFMSQTNCIKMRCNKFPKWPKKKKLTL